MVVCVLFGVFVLAPLTHYLTSPDKALFTESGWRSYSDDRSTRIDFLLWYGADPNAFVDRSYTSFHTAVHWGSVSALRQLLDAGADVNKPTADGSRLPLDIACVFSSGKTEVIDLLVERGAKRRQSHSQDWEGVANPSACFDSEEFTSNEPA